MITTVTLNPAIDKTVEIENFTAGTVNRTGAIRIDAGGKGINVSKVIASLGGISRATGILGGRAGTFIKEYLDSIGIENNFVFVKDETRTNLKIIDRINHANTDINESGPEICDKDIKKLEKIIDTYLDDESIVVFSGSIPLGVSKEIYKELITSAGNKGSKAILDADGELLKLGLEGRPYLVKPNIHELERLFGMKIKSIEQAIDLAKSIRDKYGIKIVVISLGEKGAIFLQDESIIMAEGIKVKVASTVGAGDSMVAALAYCIDKGYSFQDSIKLAVAAGTANVMTTGTQPADLNIIMELVKQVKFRYIDG
jgi:1-phosphofructokinase